jgi:hypothetical protein
VDILTPTVDYITLTDAPDGTALVTVTLPIGGTVTAYASGYNNTGPTYVGLVTVDWIDNGGAWSPSNADTSTFTAGLTAGLFNQVGQNVGMSVSDDFNVDILTPTVDYITLTDAPDGTALGTVSLPIGGTVTAYASGYNNTGPTYVGLVTVDWIDNGGSWSPSNADTSTFTADLTAGLFNQVAQNVGMSVSDDFNVDILTPTVDYITLTDAPDGAELVTVALPVGGTTTAYASGYNSTGPTYVGLVTVDWINNGGSWSPSNADTSTFTAGLADGLFNQVALNAGMSVSDDFDIDILPPTPDDIKIRDAANNGGSVVTTMTYTIGDSDTFYAASYNDTTGYIGDLDVDWTISPISGIGTVNAGPAGSTTFDAVGAGTCTVTATNSTYSVSNTTGILTVELGTLTVDLIKIMDAALGAGNEVGDMTYAVYDTDFFYAAAFNGTTYLYDVTATWQSSEALVGSIDAALPPPTFTAQIVTADDTCVVTATYNTLTDDTGTLTVLAPVADYIQIRDTPAGGGDVIGDRTFGVGGGDHFYASAYNHTVDYIGEITVVWTVDPATGVGSVDASGILTNFAAATVLADATCTVTATYGTLTNVTGTITVLAPQVDDIKIMDEAGGSGSVITTATYNAADTDIFHAAGFNKTTGSWVMDVDATWVSSDIAVGTVSASGTSTTFSALTRETAGTCTVTATYNSISNSTDITVNAGADKTPPGKPDTPVKGDVGKDKAEFSWTANTEPDLKHYVVQRSKDPSGDWANISTVNEPTTSFEDTDLEPDTTYYYRIVAVDEAGNPSTPSEYLKVKTDPADEFPLFILLLLLIIIIVVILLLVYIMTKKKKDEEEVPPGGAAAAAAPVEEAPMEEYAEEEYAPEGEYEEEYTPEETYEEEPQTDEGEYEEEVEYEEETEPETPSTPPPPPPPPPA